MKRIIQKSGSSKFFLVCALSLICFSLGYAQSNNLEDNFEQSVNNTNSNDLKSDKLKKNSDSQNMTRETWTMRDVNNQLIQLEYFFPNLTIPVPFSITSDTSEKKPQDMATSIVIPEENGDYSNTDNSSFSDIPSVDNLVKNDNPESKGNQKRNRERKQQQSGK